MLDKINAIESIRQQKKELEVREATLSQPPLSDLSLLPQLHAWFIAHYSDRDCTPRSESVTMRKKFIFIVLRLYSPITLAGGRMTPGLRDQLVETLRVHSPSVISNDCSHLIFYYHQYQDFRREVTQLYQHLLHRLKNKGHLTDSQVTAAM